MSQYRAATVFLAVMVFCFAANRSEAASAGTLTFADGAQNEMQNAANRSIAVIRTGGSSGAAAAVCRAVSGSALAGTDFTMTTTSLSWADGDATAKYCIVAMQGRTLSGGAKSFVLELTSVTGATLGARQSRTVSLRGNSSAGSVSLTSANYSVAQSTGAAALSVARTGGTTGASEVFYSTANGTAVTGTNYARTAGMLSWSDGDASPKTIMIPINNAPASSEPKTFVLALAAAKNVALGAQVSAIITIEGGAATATRTSAAADAAAAQNSATALAEASTTALLSWTPPPAMNTDGTAVTPPTGYHIYYGKEQRELTKSVVVTGAANTSCEIAGLTEGTWYFAVAADAPDGSLGPQSNVASKTIQGSPPPAGVALNHGPGSGALIYGAANGGTVENSMSPTG